MGNQGGEQESQMHSPRPLWLLCRLRDESLAAKWWWEDGREQVKEELMGLGEGERQGTQAQLPGLWLR